MVVRTKCKGHEVTGLLVGASNARRYFPRHISAIQLELDHLRIECGLPPDFWHGEAEIHDRRLCAWLAQKQFHGQAGRDPIPLDMVPSGKNCFRLGPVPLRDSKDKPAPLPLAASTMA